MVDKADSASDDQAPLSAAREAAANEALQSLLAQIAAHNKVALIHAARHCCISCWAAISAASWVSIICRQISG